MVPYLFIRERLGKHCLHSGSLFHLSMFPEAIKYCTSRSRESNIASRQAALVLKAEEEMP